MNRFLGVCGLIILLCGGGHLLLAQSGGQKSFEFLSLPTNARTAALGGVNVSWYGDDVNQFLSNPALLNTEVSRHLALNYLDFYAGIGYTNLVYAFNNEKTGNWGIGMQYLNYGEIEGRDETGVETGKFRASDFAINVSKSHQIGPINMGVNLRFLYSGVESFKAQALVADIGGVFKHPNQDLSIGLVFKHVGFLLSDFSATSNSKIPFDVQTGVSFKPTHMPVRFSLTAYNLVNKLYEEKENLTEEQQAEEPSVVDKMARHLAIGLELLLSKNFNVRAGYNHLQRKELRLEGTSGGAGLSFGFQAKIKAFELAYSRSFYHTAGGTNYLTFGGNLDSLFKKKL
ncbi:type IX secretion system protein PorQ [Xanthovirga aplysinae]|uniref:type IX secretion system protein PorQ n=1 Tax=Xanthovirga aplysinae TaxID=2529853 RepID=UPI0012BBAE68|nr:type IX secretion system protein PorQ [Xanthovirga aplysinae]MTI31045.1 type IX secretion system protein PorQ [Xanthovirga aplysinae]